MPCPTELLPLLGAVPDREIASRAGVSKQAVAKWRRALGIAACGPAPAPAVEHAAPNAAPAGPRTPDDPATPDRLAYLETTLRGIHEAIANTNDTKALAGLYTAALKVRRELDELRKAETTKRAALPKSIEEQVAMLKRDCKKLPDQLLEAVVEVYCARHRLALPRTRLPTIGRTG